MTLTADRPVPRPALTYPSGAVEVLPPDAPHEQWLDERRRSVGGSDASVMLGVNRWSSRMSLWLDKTGRAPAEAPTGAMEWGTLLEPVIVGWLARQEGLRIVPAGLTRRPDYPYVHANPDGIVIDGNDMPIGGVEAKTLSWRLAHEWDHDQASDHAEAQAQLCMAVTGLRRWWVVALQDGRYPHVRPLDANDSLQRLLLDEATKFWVQHVIPDEPPALDGSTATLDAVTSYLRHPAEGKAIPLTLKLRELFAAHQRAKAAVKAAEEAERLAHAAVRMAMEDAAVVVDDVDRPIGPKPADGGATVYATAMCNGTFSPSAFRQAEPEKAAKYTHEVSVTDAARLKTEDEDTYRRFCARVIRPRKTLTDAITAAAATLQES